jgi:pectate lyase
MKKVLFTASIILSVIFLPISGFAQTPAFPGAEGGGKHTTGGRGGKVLYVTSLEDSEEEGTLRWAVRKKGPRTILFKVSGTIQLKEELVINNGDVTIAGQSAPGDGICIRDYKVAISADNVIIRYLRFRLGDETQQVDDAMSSLRNKNVIIDHCSMSWGIDECGSFYDNENFTLQWCILAESLKNSVHGKGEHGYGGIWGGKNASFHHNLIMSHDNRTPRFCGSRYSNEPDLERVDFRNNVIYNWGSNNIYAGEGGLYNLVNNYFKPGPASKHTDRFLNPYADDGKNSQPAGTYGKFFVKGNYIEGNKKVTHKNELGVELDRESFQKYAPVRKENVLVSEEFVMPYQVPITSARKAYKEVLQYAGASLVRDKLDARYVSEVESGTYTFEGSKGSTGGLIDSQTDVGAWITYNSFPAPVDSNNDGIPDGWLEKNYPEKKSTDFNKQGYTYLEVYLNSLLKP